MIDKIDVKNKKWLYPVLCVLTGLVALLPVGCNYIMSGGNITEWIARVEELAVGFQTGDFYLFPTVDLFLDMGISGNGMNSNLWFLLIGVLYRLTGDMVLVYRIGMIFLQVGTLLTSMLFFQKIFAEADTQLPAFFGVLLYMTCPYRIYVCYDLADMSKALVWLLLPLYGWAMMGLLQEGKKGISLGVAALALAGIGYADAVSFIIITCVTILALLPARGWWGILSVVIGCGLFAPGLVRLLQYVFLGRHSEWNFSTDVIMSKGYQISEFFTVYVWKDGHPGMGPGLLLCIGAGIWLWFVLGRQDKQRLFGGCTVLAVLGMVLALSSFPWDLLQRVGGFALRFVGLMGTPAIFAGLAFGILCIPAAHTMRMVSKEENQGLAFVLPLIVWVVCMAGCIYQCNLLTYSRVPMVLP